MVFHWSLSDSKSPQVSSILAVLNNGVVWMVSSRLSKSSIPFSNPIVTVRKAPITIGIIATCMFHSFFQFPNKVEVLIFFFTFFQFYFVISRDKKVDYFAISLFFLFLLIIIRSGLLAEIRWSVCMLLLLLLFTPLEFFTSVLADGFSLEFEWQQVSSSLQDSSQDSGRP